jgi:general L-amino acid transport system permease protein
VATEITASDIGREDTVPIPDEPRLPKQKLPPGKWVKKNLFNTWYNSALTIVLGAVVLFLLYKAIAFVFFTARWEPVTENLTLFMVGRFPRDELWRLIAAILLWSAAGGLATGTAVAGAKYRAMQSGIPYVEEKAITRVRRYWAVFFLLAVLLFATATIWPLVLTAASFLLGAVLYQLALRISGEYGALVWASVAVVFVLGYQIVSGFGGTAWLWMAVPVAGAAWWLVGRRSYDSVRKERVWQAAGAALGALGVFAVYTFVLADRGGVGWDKWEGFHLSLIVATVSIVLAFPLGLLLALARRSSFPAISWMATGYIELIRGVPLISLLLMALFFIGFFINTRTPLSTLTRAIAAMTLFTAAYIAEIVRGGLQSVPRGQVEAGQSIGLSQVAITRRIVLPQALRAVIPAMVGQFISLFKDTTLLTIIGVSEILNVRELVHAQADFRGFGIAETLIFVMLAFWAISYTMSRESQRLEKRLGVGER